MFDFVFSPDDETMLSRLQQFLPGKIFDAHSHIYNLAHMPNAGAIYNAYGDATAKRFLEDQKLFYGDRTVKALFLPFPATNFRDKQLRHEVNKWMVNQLEDAPDCVCELYVAPGDTEKELEAQLTDSRIKGFKCYHLTTEAEGPTALTDIDTYLPECVWQVADRHGLFITLHMVKELSLSDPVNLAYIKEKTARYPNAKLILAHCARGFASWQTVEAVRKLKGIGNIYYDMAAICDPATIYEVIRQAGADHVLWGSDYPIDRDHCKAFSVKEGFLWLYNDNSGFSCNMLALESLFAFWQACLMLDASREDIENIFYYNAIRLFGLEA